MIAFYAFWCGACWVLRGGKYGDIHRYLFGREPGTTVTRLVCAFLMVAPLAVAIDPALIALWPSVFLAMTLGYFDESMGLEQPCRDHLFLALWGLVVAAISVAPLAALDFGVLVFAPIGALAVAAYAINKPFGGHWTQRAEGVTGALMGCVLYLGALAL